MGDCVLDTDPHEDLLLAGDSVVDIDLDEDALWLDDCVLDTDVDEDTLWLDDCVVDIDLNEDALWLDDCVTSVLIDADTVDESEAYEEEDVVYDDTTDPLIDVVPLLDICGELELVTDMLAESLEEDEPLTVLDFTCVIDIIGDSVGDLDSIDVLDGLILTELLRELDTVADSE